MPLVMRAKKFVNSRLALCIFGVFIKLTAEKLCSHKLRHFENAISLEQHGFRDFFNYLCITFNRNEIVEKSH